MRDQQGKRFVYKDIKPVHTIVLFEKSPQEFKQFPEHYIHYVEQKSDTGLQLNLLQKYVFICLDNYNQKAHNEPIKDELEAWLTFFSTDEPEMIEHLISAYPKFKEMYETIYEMCLNTEKVMEMFSKELQILDKNTVQYMIDEMQVVIDKQQGKIDEQQGTIHEQQETIQEKDRLITQLKEQLSKMSGI